MRYLKYEPNVHHSCIDYYLIIHLWSISAAKLNIDELEAGYPLFCKALRLLILKGNSVKDIEKTVCWSHLETLNRCLPGRYKAPTYLMALIKRDIAKPNNY